MSAALTQPAFAPTTALPALGAHEAVVRRAPSKAITLRAICFLAGGYEFALPVAAVAKVAHCPPLAGNDLARVGLVRVDHQVIEVLNLQDILLSFPAARPDPPVLSNAVPNGEPAQEVPHDSALATAVSTDEVSLPKPNRDRPAPLPPMPGQFLPGQFLIVARSATGQPCGLLAEAPPDLLDLDRACIQTLPDTWSRSPLAGLAQSVALLPPDHAPRTIFLLDLARAITLARTPHARSLPL